MKAIFMIVCLGIGTYLFVFNKKIPIFGIVN